MAKAALPGQDEALTGQIIRWFDATLKGKAGPLESLPPVRVFLMGTNRWLGFESFPPAEAATRSWFLGAGSTLGTVPAEPGGQVSYDYDPTDPAPTVGGPILMAPAFRVGPVAQNELYDRDDVVSFTSDPLADPLHVIGAIRAVLHAETSAVDTDFVVTLCDVHPDGRSILIADGIVRVSERDSYTDDGVFRPGARSLVEPGEDLELRVDLLATAHTFGSGHRIRVDVTSSNFPRWDVNLNTGASFYESDTSVLARQTLKFGGLHKSRIELPVVPGATVAQASL
jgi:putative CocE/NonD family hydrolase